MEKRWENSKDKRGRKEGRNKILTNKKLRTK